MASAVAELDRSIALAEWNFHGPTVDDIIAEAKGVSRSASSLVAFLVADSDQMRTWTFDQALLTKATCTRTELLIHFLVDNNRFRVETGMGLALKNIKTKCREIAFAGQEVIVAHLLYAVAHSRCFISGSPGSD